jgi:hypothetical protein
MARARGLASWQPRAKSLALLVQVNAVLHEYAQHLPLTIRQIFYRLVGAYAYDKTEQAYDRLGEMLNRARRAGFVQFEAIRDDGVDMRVPTAWQDAEDLVEAIRDSITEFRLDRQQGQSRRLLIAVEAAGMLPQIERIAGPYGIPVQSSGGFDSLTAKYGLAEFLGESSAAEAHRRLRPEWCARVQLARGRRLRDLRRPRARRRRDVHPPSRDSEADRHPRPADGTAKGD